MGWNHKLGLHYWKNIYIFSDVISVENPLSIFRIMVPTKLVNGFSPVRIFGNSSWSPGGSCWWLVRDPERSMKGDFWNASKHYQPCIAIDIQSDITHMFFFQTSINITFYSFCYICKRPPWVLIRVFPLPEPQVRFQHEKCMSQLESFCCSKSQFPYKKNGGVFSWKPIRFPYET